MEPRDLLAQLIRIPSVNPMGRQVSGEIYGERKLSDFLVELFRTWGLPAVRVPVHPDRDNVVALYEPPSPNGTILLDAHQDTVPVEGMSVDPFQAVERNGRMYGRGACDVKGGMAAMLAALGRLVVEKPRHAARVFFSATCDEEAGASGMEALIRQWPQVSAQLCGSPITPQAAIVSEPTGLAVVVAHLGVVRWWAVASGRACHSSSPEYGSNAIYLMARIVDALASYDRQLQTAGPFHPLCGRPSLSVGRIEGGSSVNVVPDWCRIEIDRRLVPGEQAASVVEQVRNFVENELNRLGQHKPIGAWRFEPPYLTSPPLSDRQNRELAVTLARHVEMVVGRADIVGVRYGTHASRLAAAGIPSVVFGPGHIEQAHTEDEWIDLQEVEQAAQVYYRFCCDR
ncbi:MAG: acetylornithine deacetylase [Pirellulaceae bacterium]|nr:MAG: acetylornithine deacetylase [Pirellulaceae bacterium]